MVYRCVCTHNRAMFDAGIRHGRVDTFNKCTYVSVMDG